MLGRYDFFPSIFHGKAEFEYNLDKGKLQVAIIKTLLKLNSQSAKVSEVTGLIDYEMQVYFEFGFAEGKAFTFIDEDEANSILREIEKEPFTLMDFFCVLKYYKTVDGTLKPLKFDYSLIRFEFEDERLSVLYFHERGTKRIEFSQLIKFILSNMLSILGRRSRKGIKEVSLLEA
ncbi:MAG: hypothetical protein QXL67_05330 [Candidatus Bathyarchaeia archaeon]